MRRQTLIAARAVSLVVALAWMTVGCSHPKEVPAISTQTVGGLSISFTTVNPSEPTWPPHSGDITGIVGIHDAATGTAIDDASVVASANMTAPTSPGAPASGRSQGNGQYWVPLRVIATTYSVDVHIEQVGHPAVDASFPLNVWQ